MEQVSEDIERGAKVKAFYKLTELPTTMIIDPVTGAAYKTWVGAIEPQRYVNQSNFRVVCGKIFSRTTVWHMHWHQRFPFILMYMVASNAPMLQATVCQISYADLDIRAVGTPAGCWRTWCHSWIMTFLTPYLRSWEGSSSASSVLNPLPTR